METIFETKEKKGLNLKVIYEPKGKAGEYAKYAVNLYNGCTHGCRKNSGKGIILRTI